MQTIWPGHENRSVTASDHGLVTVVASDATIASSHVK